eukprot:XP_001702384.1 predicted protein [Chlamydomonas reinhardtii]
MSVADLTLHLTGVVAAMGDPRVAPLGPQQQRPPYGPGGEAGPSAGASTSSFDSQQESDPISEIARSAVDAVTGCLAFLVGRLSDAALSLLPSHVKRKAVENTVKGALALLGLALLQSVLSLVLTVGTLVLAVYAAYQVFGVQLPFLPPQPGSGETGAGYGYGSYRQEGGPGPRPVQQRRQGPTIDVYWE